MIPIKCFPPDILFPAIYSAREERQQFAFKITFTEKDKIKNTSQRSNFADVVSNLALCGFT